MILISTVKLNQFSCVGMYMFLIKVFIDEAEEAKRKYNISLEEYHKSDSYKKFIVERTKAIEGLIFSHNIKFKYLINQVKLIISCISFNL